jgi:hypothetical protein
MTSGLSNPDGQQCVIHGGDRPAPTWTWTRPALICR